MNEKAKPNEVGRPMTVAEAEFHRMRKSIDGNIEALRDMGAGQGIEVSEEMEKALREMELAYTKLQEAKMWMGKALEAIGTPFPKELRDSSKD